VVISGKGGQVFVDESKNKDYLLIAVGILPSKFAPARKAIQSLVLPGQSRIHMKTESDSRRKLILSRLAELSFDVTIYRAPNGTGTELERRSKCIEALVMEAANELRTHITLELDTTIESRDRNLLYRSVRTLKVEERLYYRHEKPSVEPLLMIPDAIGWAWARGGSWRKRLETFSLRIIEV
jgi:hypothetical protein